MNAFGFFRVGSIQADHGCASKPLWFVAVVNANVSTAETGKVYLKLPARKSDTNRSIVDLH